MNFKKWLYQAAALWLAWALLIFGACILDGLLHTIVALVLVSWLYAGIVVMLCKNVAFPMPRTDQVDIARRFSDAMVGGILAWISEVKMMLKLQSANRRLAAVTASRSLGYAVSSTLLIPGNLS